MKKLGFIATAAMLAGAAGFVALQRAPRDAASAADDVSEKSAERLQAKIDAVEQASTKSGDRRREQVEVSEVELESYVMFHLRDEIPARMDSIDVQLTPGAVAADTQLTFTSDATGNSLIDTLIGGTHNFFLKGRLSGVNGQGKFELDEVRVDGIPVPKVLIETLVKRYVTPKYPDTDLKAPFELPWKIDQITIDQGKAIIVY